MLVGQGGTSTSVSSTSPPTDSPTASPGTVSQPGLPGQETVPTCVSGGADGSDLHWGACAAAVGHRVVHLGFAGHRTSAPPETYYTISQDKLVAADGYLDLAAEVLQRDWRRGSEYVKNLLRRNYYQIFKARAVYGIVPRLDTQRRPVGGTAWALQMFVDRHGGRSCAVYLFIQSQHSWAHWNGTGWAAMAAQEVPVPHGVWAGVGCRPERLTREGRDAASVLLGLPPTAPGQLSLGL